MSLQEAAIPAGYVLPATDTQTESPLYKLQKGKDIQYAWTDEELDELRKTFPKGFSLQRYKGLGEMNADQLWDTTMCPETRTLIQVTIDDAVVAEKRVSVLMGDKANLRRDWIEENVSFTLDRKSVV